jgi:hypothetical protein
VKFCLEIDHKHTNKSCVKHFLYAVNYKHDNGVKPQHYINRNQITKLYNY